MSADRARNMRSKVQALQSKLSHAAKQTLDRRFGALYDKIYREDVLWVAWRGVRTNRGAPGIDGESIEYIEGVIGVDVFLEEIREELHSKRYRPQAVRRCWIDKPGKAEKRPLGIPVVKDRVIQMATKLVIEPIFEMNFLSCSYGFRPDRSAHMAIDAIRETITFKGQSVVIDADIVGFFGNIRQDILLTLLRRRISDPRVLKLIRGWLEAGVMEGAEYIQPDGLGTPQGGVISPLLSNIYLHSFDKMFQMSGIPGTLVRYCDDFVILLRGNGKKVLERVRQMLFRLGLELHRDKTRLVHARQGFDFLGVHFRLCRTRKREAKLRWYCAVWPSDGSVKRIKDRLRQVVGRRYYMSLEEMIEELNPVIRGWNSYHMRVGLVVRKRIRELNGFIRARIRIFLKRKYGDQSRGNRRVHNRIIVRLGLYQFG
jgi:group II intron reverse transcriptase/maturase